MELCFYYLLSKIEGCLSPTLAGAATFNSRERERQREREQNINKKRSFQTSIKAHIF